MVRNPMFIKHITRKSINRYSDLFQFTEDFDLYRFPNSDVVQPYSLHVRQLYQDKNNIDFLTTFYHISSYFFM